MNYFGNINGINLLGYEDGRIEKWKDNWVECTQNIDGKGRKYICLNKKNYAVHRVIAYLFHGLDITNPKLIVDHIDRDYTNNHSSNLRITNMFGNTINTTRDVKGCYKYTNRDLYYATINYDGGRHYLGTFKTEQEARNAYDIAKLKHHIVPLLS